MITRRFRVTGKVQGVYFRHSTKTEAERLALGGVARNLPDGSVEVIAHGDPAAIERLRQWLHRGPSMARVAGVQEIEVSHSIEGASASDTGPGPTSFRVE